MSSNTNRKAFASMSETELAWIAETYYDVSYAKHLNHEELIETLVRITETHEGVACHS